MKFRVIAFLMFLIPFALLWGDGMKGMSIRALATRYAVFVSTPNCEKQANEILEYMRKNKMVYIDEVYSRLVHDLNEPKIAQQFCKNEYIYSPNLFVIEKYCTSDIQSIDWNFIIKTIEDGFIPSNLRFIINSFDAKPYKKRIFEAISGNKKNLENIDVLAIMFQEAILNDDYPKAYEILKNPNKKEIVGKLTQFSTSFKFLKLLFENGSYTKIHAIKAKDIPDSDSSEFAKLARFISTMDLSSEAENLYKKYYKENVYIAVLYCMSLRARGEFNFDEVKKYCIPQNCYVVDSYIENEEFIDTALMLFSKTSMFIPFCCILSCNFDKLTIKTKESIVSAIKESGCVDSALYALSLKCLLHRDSQNDKLAFEFCKECNVICKNDSRFRECLSVMFYKGIGTQVNHKKAFELVSDEKLIQNWVYLYYYHKYGIGTPKNLVKAKLYEDKIRKNNIDVSGVFNKSKAYWGPILPIDDYNEYLIFIDDVYELNTLLNEKKIKEQDYFTFSKRLFAKFNRYSWIHFFREITQQYLNGHFKDKSNIEKIEQYILLNLDKKSFGKTDKDAILALLLRLKLETTICDNQRTFALINDYLNKFDFENKITKSNILLAEKLAYVLDKGKGCKVDKARAEAIRLRIKKFSQTEDKDYCYIRKIIYKYVRSKRSLYYTFDITAAKYWIDWFLETNPNSIAYSYAYLYARTIELDFPKFRKYYKLYLESSYKENLKKISRLPMFIFSSCGYKEFDDIKTLLRSLENFANIDPYAYEWLSYMYHKGLGVEQDKQKSDIYFEKFIKNSKYYPATCSYKYIRGEYGFTDIDWARKIYDASIKADKLSKKKYPTFESYVEFIKKKRSIFY